MGIKSNKWQEVDINKLVAADWNYKKEDFEMSRKLVANIKRNGQIENILVRELDTGFYEVVNGNHRLTAFTELELEKVVCFNLGKISNAQARRIAIETNETRFETDTLKLADLIKEMVDDEFELADLTNTLPYNESDLNAMIDLLGFDWDKNVPDDDDPPPQDPDDPTLSEEHITCPNCGVKIKIEE
jgi:ParB-like chromosome segregation protein Spo0J